MNEKKRELELKMEEKKKVAEIQSRFENGDRLNLVQPNRKFIREALVGEMKGFQTKEITLLLFTDLLVRAKALKNGKLKFGGMVSIEKMKVSAGEQGGLQFLVSDVDKPNKHFTFFTTNVEATQQWMKDLRTLMLEKKLGQNEALRKSVRYAIFRTIG